MTNAEFEDRFICVNCGYAGDMHENWETEDFDGPYACLFKSGPPTHYLSKAAKEKIDQRWKAYVKARQK